MVVQVVADRVRLVWLHKETPRMAPHPMAVERAQVAVDAT